MQNSQADSRSTPDSLRGSPDSLRPVVPKDIQPVHERLDARRDVEHISLAVITAAVSKIGGTRCVPEGGPGGINTERVCVVEDDICALDIRREVVVLHSWFDHSHSYKRVQSLPGSSAQWKLGGNHPSHKSGRTCYQQHQMDQSSHQAREQSPKEED